jgi:hypothetical protein
MITGSYTVAVMNLYDEHKIVKYVLESNKKYLQNQAEYIVKNTSMDTTYIKLKFSGE